MQTRKYFLLRAVVVAIGVVFAATEVKAQPTQCVAGQYTVNFVGRFPDASQGTARWQYKVQATSAHLNSIIEGVMVVPLPVTPNDIKSPTPQNFCDEADPHTKINRGNCAGFPVHLRPERSGDTVLLEIITAGRIPAGVVTLNIVSGEGSSDVCVAFVNNQPTGGIEGPGAPGGQDLFRPDLFLPVFVVQEVMAAGGNCRARLIFDTRGQLIDVQNVPEITPRCVTGEARIFITRDGVRLGELQNNTGPHGITFGNNTTTCYGPKTPSPPKCICTQEPCP